ncbi:MAG: hypothetical protein J5365_04375 [Erysipelotrichaceae bacterium]|nr:hypothetical protein [Erysipelotrichaceae bacterium]
MKEEIKKKFIDILFESDDDEEDDPSLASEEKPEKKKADSSVKAADILYHKSEKSAFIDLDEQPKTIKSETRTGEPYEFSTQISPIFGVLKGGQEPEEVKKDIDETQINKPEDSHLEIITSPIYGYASRESVQKEETEEEPESDPYDEEELHRLLLSEDERYSRYDDDDLNLFEVFGDDD